MLKLLQPAWFRWGLFLTCLILLLYGMFRPSPPVEVFTHSDKAGHLVAFFCLCVTAKLAMPTLRWYMLLSGLVTLSFLLEYLQSAWRPLRVFSLEDSYSNLGGVLLAFLLMIYLQYAFPMALSFDNTLKGSTRKADHSL